jgi:hypothetical protein
MKRIFFIAISVLMLVCAVTFPVHAQNATADLVLSTIPLDPQPGQQVTVTAQSYAADLSQDMLVWTYNGKTIGSSTGQTQITVTAPAAGNTGTIVVTASGSDLDSAITASLTLRPGSVDLLWEGADSYTPPFYKGRALPSSQGIIRVVAVPSINAPRQMSFDWTQNDNALPSQSGFNKSSLLFQNDSLVSTEHISVTESGGNFSGNGSVDITPGDPGIVGYINSDGYIDYANGSTGNFNISGTGTIIHLEPYFFSALHSIDTYLTFAYTDAVGNVLPSGDSQNELRLSAPAGGGLSQFNVSIGTKAYTLQNITRPFSINFD